jgi:hypothetical protein
MAITFDPTNKIIQLDTFSVSASEIWSRWIDWVVLSDNAKYLPAFSQLGGVAPVALYIYLENSWKVRPQEANGITGITGNLLVQGGGSPIAATVGSFQVLVNLEAPIAAQAIEVNTGSAVNQATVQSALTAQGYTTARAPELDKVNTVLDNTAAIKVKTDDMTYTKDNELDVNVKSENSAIVYGTGISSDKWRGTE